MNNNKLFKIGDLIKNLTNNQLGIVLFFKNLQLFTHGDEIEDIYVVAFENSVYPVWSKDLELIYRD